jgi:hypothetical protein
MNLSTIFLSLGRVESLHALKAAAKGEASRGGGGGSSSRGDGDGCAWGFAFLKTFGGETPHDIASK